MPLCGGTGDPQAPTEEVVAIVTKLKPEVEAKVGTQFSIFELVSQRSQVVAGINYFCKVRVGDNEYVHVRIYRNLQGSSELHGVQANKTESDSLEYFQED